MKQISDLLKLVLMTLFMCCLGGVAGQKVTIVKKNVTLEKVFKQIEKQTGYYFVYRDEWLKNSKKISVDIKNVELKQALEICFKNQPLAFSIVDKLIVIKQKSNVAKQKSTQIKK